MGEARDEDVRHGEDGEDDRELESRVRARETPEATPE